MVIYKNWTQMHGQQNMKFKPFICIFMETEPQDFQNQIHNKSVQNFTTGDQEMIFSSVITPVG